MSKQLTISQSTAKMLAHGQVASRITDALGEAGAPSVRFLQTAQRAVTTGYLAEILDEGKVDVPSLRTAVEQCATDNLSLDGREAALIPYWNKGAKKFHVQYIPMFQGLIKRMVRLGGVERVVVHVVYASEPFETWIDDTGEHIRHRPNAFAPVGERGEPVGAYASAYLESGGAQHAIMGATEILTIASDSRNAKEYDPKAAHWTEWWKKTAVRRLAKMVVLGGDASSLFAAADREFTYNSEVEAPEVEAPEAEPVKPKRPAKSRARAKVVQSSQDITDAEYAEVRDINEGVEAGSSSGASSGAPQDEELPI